MALTLLRRSFPFSAFEILSKSRSTASIHMATGLVTLPFSPEWTPDLVLYSEGARKTEKDPGQLSDLASALRT
jgi:hypothetical protein